MGCGASVCSFIKHTPGPLPFGGPGPTGARPLPRRRAQAPLGAQSRAGCGVAFLLTGGRPPGGQPGAPRHSGDTGGRPHFVVTAVAVTPGPGRPGLLPTPGRVVQPCGTHTCGKLEYRSQEINQQEKNRIWFCYQELAPHLVGAFSCHPLTEWKPCLQGPPPEHICLLSQCPIPQGVLEHAGHSQGLGLGLPALVPSPGSWAHTRMGLRAQGSASP